MQVRWLMTMTPPEPRSEPAAMTDSKSSGVPSFGGSHTGTDEPPGMTARSSWPSRIPPQMSFTKVESGVPSASS